MCLLRHDGATPTTAPTATPLLQVSFIMHFPDPANQMAMIHFLKNMCILGAVLLLATDRRRAATEKAKAA